MSVNRYSNAVSLAVQEGCLICFHTLVQPCLRAAYELNEARERTKGASGTLTEPVEIPSKRVPEVPPARVNKSRNL
eukprot:2492652-Pyramimonas_sp.AAC.1